MLEPVALYGRHELHGRVNGVRRLVCVIAWLAVARAVPLNRVQLLGTHNSYHLTTKPELDALASLDPEMGALLNATKYSHPPLTEQLEDFKVRVLELDVFQDTEGGKWAFRAADAFLNLPDALDTSAEMQAPGFKVLHLDSIDYNTTCKTLQACLTPIRTWSNSHVDHVPVVLVVEFKTLSLIEELETLSPSSALTVETLLASTAKANPAYPQSMPRAADAEPTGVAALIEEIVEHLGDQKLLKPDELRGEAATLKQALEQDPDGFWPDVDTIRGRVIVIVASVEDAMLELYGPSLAGSPVFTRGFISANLESSDVGVSIPEHTVFLASEIAGASRLAPELLDAGYILLGRADKDTVQARAQDFTAQQQLFAEGIQVVFTDFLEPSTLFQGGNYSVQLPCGRAPACDLTFSQSAPLEEASEGADGSNTSGLTADASNTGRCKLMTGMMNVLQFATAMLILAFYW